MLVAFSAAALTTIAKLRLLGLQIFQTGTLLTIENEETGYAPNDLFLEDYSRDQISYHALILLKWDW